MEVPRSSDESRILVIYTGGTIGMLVGREGYRNEPHFLTETLRSQARFHDPLEDSLFSHSRSVEGYRKWSSSGRSSPSSESQVIPGESTLLTVKSTRPQRPSLLASQFKGDAIEAKQIEKHVYECMLPSLVTPRVSVQAGTSSPRRIRYVILEWDPLLDSSNVDTEDWVRIATEIELNYSAFDAFVILHGTDTMSYTASALSFMLEDLGKTVIITGAQIPLSELRNDAVDNLLGALSIAGHFIIPECCLYFNHCLYRGNRCSKISSYDLEAFTSPNFPPLVNVGIDIAVNWSNVLRQTSLRRFRAHKSISSRVATLRLFPGISAHTVKAFLAPPIQGVVLETFGAGNAPQRPDLMTAFREAAERGIVIVAITQCAKGTVSDAYETGRTLIQVGVVPGGDMTPECALTKLGYLLSKPEFTTEKVRDLIRLPLRGELTPSRSPSNSLSLSHNTDSMQELLSQMIRLSTTVANTAIPEIVVSPTAESTLVEAAAPWSWTAAEAFSAESSLLPLLVRLAVARDDEEALRFCLDYQDSQREIDQEDNVGNFAAGIVNTVDQGSGWTPLHVAALNGSEKCVAQLLGAGALVHMRDSLGHTALYYAARKGQELIVELLRQAGANLGGADIEGGYADLEVSKAKQTKSDAILAVWKRAGFEA